jgi:DNA-binding transcriptional LysR family regulator
VDVEMRHLRALLAVAEELNFTRAAERLHLTQQALSGQIRQLEDRVGTRLVDRDPRRVQLTAAGAALCEQARPLLIGAEQAVAAARAAGSEASHLTLGYVAALTRRMIEPALRLFAERHPEIELGIYFGTFLDPLGGLRDGSADVAILYGRFEHDGIELSFLFSEPRGIAVSATNPLASKPEVSLADFIAEPIVDVPINDPVCRDFWIAAELRHGKPPRIGATTTTLDSMIEAIGAGLGVAATVDSAVKALGSSGEIVFRPLPGLPPLEFWVARREGDERPQVTAFVEAAQAAYGRSPSSAGA